MATLSDGNFTGVRTSIGEWLHRTDLTNTDLGNFIYLFEKGFNTECRLRNMEAQTTIPVTTGYLAHPSDWQGWKSIKVVQGGLAYPLKPMSEEQAAEVFGRWNPPGAPQGYVVRGDRTYVVPEPLSVQYSYETTYYQGVPALGPSNTTNWLLTAYPMLYLFGSLVEASNFVPANDDAVAKWQAYRDSWFSKVELASQKASFSGGIPQILPDRWF